MIAATDFKRRATWFRKQAKKLGINRPLSTLLDIFTYAHYGRGYASIYCTASQQGLAEPRFPPPFLELTATRFEVAPDLVLEALEPQIRCQRQRLPPRSIGWEEFERLAQRFHLVAPNQGLNLSLPSARELFTGAYFDSDYAAIASSLRDGDSLVWPSSPEFLGAACALYGMDQRKVLAAIRLVANEFTET